MSVAFAVALETVNRENSSCLCDVIVYSHVKMTLKWNITPHMSKHPENRQVIIYSHILTLVIFHSL